MKTMNELHNDGSNHIGCEKCGFCITCGDCKKYGCGYKKIRKEEELTEQAKKDIDEARKEKGEPIEKVAKKLGVKL